MATPSPGQPGPPREPPADVRLRGFARRASLQEAVAWIDATSGPFATELVRTEDAVGRVLHRFAAGLAGAAARAAADGFAVRAQETEGAAPYAPLLLALQDPGPPLAPGAAALVSAGMAPPPGADAIVPFTAAQAHGSVVEVVAAVAVGTGFERRDEALRAAAALPRLRPLRPHDVALLAALGIARVEVVRRPGIRVIVAGPKGPASGGAAVDACGPMLRALLARDGAAVEVVTAGARGGVAAALRDGPAPDAVLVVGRSGVGPDDEAPCALREVGALDLHGLAIRPGGSVGLGRAKQAPTVLLPGDPLACLYAYELVAGRLVRRLAGRDAGLPHAVREAALVRKLVSAVGFVDACSVRLVEGRAEPTGVEDGGIAAAVRADGFVVVPEPLEGYPVGACVVVHLHQPF